ncbi:endonuclease/exonuclease/phosphatase family protein [Pelagicoccus sp. SDUM812005]|uniref:endonuclease/exonuclease/phosphatase family protein n=1 Tax=Pelagicoccus sp. SDUM812005 TaxID=3041257 RepID=UPI00280EE22F|nr:endonuclease/exonuclease/phosphatase family protein [Pelagicoccus sp. SDUM812005]MDQ8180767.1 endonuclease/exonuclease/phosphatase family protein [Pelagicoccus sp. SDUM812005]
MKRIAGLLIALAALASSGATELSLMSYNIRLDLPSDGPNRWDNRKQQLAAQIASLAPDILGIQEGLPHQVDALQASLPGYRYIGVGRDDGKRQGEFSALYYQPEKTELIASDTFWLSPTPDLPSYGWGAHYRRICTYGHFRDRQSGSTYWVFNTHFDHEVPEARLNGAKLILARIQERVAPGESYFLMGDLNATPEAPPIQLLSQRLRDSRLHAQTLPFGPEATFNAFDPHQIPSQRIDYIFTDPQTQVTTYATHSDLIDARHLSDHFPVLIKARLPQAPSSKDSTPHP